MEKEKVQDSKIQKVQMTLFHQAHHKRFVEGLGLKAHGLKLRLGA